MDYLAIAARDLGRSSDFYRRVFGLRILEDARTEEHAYVLMHSRGGVHLKIYAHRDATPSVPRPPRAWRFVVADIDRAREAVWNLGVAPSDGTIEPQPVPGRPRSFSIHDPDGHEIELVEGRLPLVHACPSMRRAVHCFTEARRTGARTIT